MRKKNCTWDVYLKAYKFYRGKGLSEKEAGAVAWVEALRFTAPSAPEQADDLNPEPPHSL